jgi:hypothetical protein
MHCSQDDGKYFTRKWNRDRGDCMLDSSRYTDAQKTYYEVTGSNPYEGEYQGLENTLSNLETCPIDPLTSARRYDQRSKPEV